MKNFVFGSLVTLLAGAAGCTVSSSTAFCGDGILDPGESCDDGNNVDGDGCSATCALEVTPHTTHASWQIKNIDGSNSGCPAGFDTAIVVSWKVDSSGHTVGTCAPGGSPSDSCYLDIFNCSAGAGTTGPIPDTTRFPTATGGRFLTFVAITNTSGSNVFAETRQDTIDLQAGNGVFPNDADGTDGTVYKNGGFFAASWTLVGATSGNQLTCAQAASGGVSVLSTVTGGTASVDDVFKCTDGYAVTGGIKAGSYTVSVSALDTSTPALALGTPTNKAAQIIQEPTSAACNPVDCITDLGMLSLSVDGL